MMGGRIFLLISNFNCSTSMGMIWCILCFLPVQSFSTSLWWRHQWYRPLHSAVPLRCLLEWRYCLWFVDCLMGVKFESCFFNGFDTFIGVQLLGIEFLIIGDGVDSVPGCSCLAVLFIIKNMQVVMKYSTQFSFLPHQLCLIGDWIFGKCLLGKGHRMC